MSLRNGVETSFWVEVRCDVVGIGRIALWSRQFPSSNEPCSSDDPNGNSGVKLSMLRGQEGRGGMAEITEDSRNVQVVRDGVAGFEQILLDKDVVVVVWPMS